ncbi:fibrinogen-like protein A [Dysidea avara]|uniref:fibrinogen-like protein A n=1 Tax=Dysidea avara TaxID=196820 RepID=UPI0033293A6C
MATFHIIIVSLFATGMASNYCDYQLERLQTAKRNLHHNCTLKTTTVKTCCDVNDLYSCNAPSGIYQLKCWCGERWNRANVYCDTTSGDGGWIVIQRRKDGSVNFDRSIDDYEKGFGNLDGEFWYGLRAIHCLTYTGEWRSWELRIDFEFQNRTKSYMHYSYFQLGPPGTYYVYLGKLLGITPTDPIRTGGHNYRSFTTYDRDNDRYSGCCATRYGRLRGNGGWWYNKCWHINPNLKFGPSQFGFLYLAGRWYNPRWIEMKIRPRNCQPLTLI